MNLKERTYASILAVNVAISPMLDYEIQKEPSHELHKPQITYEQHIETPKHLRDEGIRNLSKSLKDMTEEYIEAKKEQDEARERIESSKSPPYSYSNSPPPTAKQIADNLHELQKEYTPRHKELNKLIEMKEHLEDIHDTEAKITEIKSNRKKFQNPDNQIKRLENSRNKAYEMFKREYNLVLKETDKTLEKVQKQIAIKKQELEPTEEKIKALREQHRKQLEIERENAKSQTRDRTQSYERQY